MAILTAQLHRFTVDDYEGMSQAGVLPERGIELLDGLVVQMSPKGDRHAFAVSELTEQFADQRRQRYRVNAENLSLRLGVHDEPEPDLVLARATRDYARERPRPNEVALLIEVSDSSLDADLGDKLQRYATAGISEYWVVDLVHDRLHVFRNPQAEHGAYENSTSYGAGDIVAPSEYPDATIDVARVLGMLPQ